MNVEDLLLKSKDFLGNFGQERFVDQLLEFYDSDQFKLCIVGGFSRGKSHFINSLLGKSILPESAVPTTGYKTEIRYGREEKLEIVYPERVETERLSTEMLEKFSLYNGSSGNISLKIYLPLPLLEKGLVIIDTPGIEDALGDAEDISRTSLEDADAAIVMVSAAAPFSLTECAFINEYLLDRKLPLIAAGISYIDKIPDESRKKQLEFIIKRCHGFYPDMKILAPECFGAAAPDLICGKDAVKSLILSWQRLPSLKKLKRIAVLSRLKEAIDGQIASLMARKAILIGNVEESRAKIAEAINNLEDGSDVALELRLRFVDQVEGVKDHIRRELRQFCDAVSRNADDLSEEKVMDAAFDLHGCLTEGAKAQLQKVVAELSKKLEQNYGVPANLANMPEIGFSPLVLTRINLESTSQNNWLDDIFQKGLNIGDMYSRRFPGGTIVWSVIKPHIRTFFIKGRDYIIGDSAVKASLKKEMNALCSRMGRQITEGIQNIYQDVFTHIKNVRLSWLEQRRTELAKNKNMEQTRKSLSEVEDKLAEAGLIAKEIDSKLGKTDEWNE